MAEMYYNLVINHKRTCDENNTAVKPVPIKWQTEVLALLAQQGYDADGNKIA